MEPEVEWYDGDYIWGNLHEDALESLIYIYINIYIYILGEIGVVG